MPLVMLHALPPKDPAAVPRMLADVRDSGSQALKCDPANVWVMFYPLQPGHYVQPDHPPVLIAKLQAGRSRPELDAFTKAITEAVARGLDVPATNVWLQYEEMKSQDVWFKGRWSA